MQQILMFSRTDWMIIGRKKDDYWENRLDDYWEKEGLMYDPEVDIYTRKLYRRAGIAT